MDLAIVVVCARCAERLTECTTNRDVAAVVNKRGPSRTRDRVRGVAAVLPSHACPGRNGERRGAEREPGHTDFRGRRGAATPATTAATRRRRRATARRKEHQTRCKAHELQRHRTSRSVAPRDGQGLALLNRIPTL